MTGADLAGVRPPSTPDTLFTGSGLGGRGWVSVGRTQQAHAVWEGKSSSSPPGPPWLRAHGGQSLPGPPVRASREQGRARWGRPHRSLGARQHLAGSRHRPVHKQTHQGV